MDQITSDSIQYGATTITYDIEFAQRKSLSICVNPDGSIYIKVPMDATLEQIREKVHREQHGFYDKNDSLNHLAHLHPNAYTSVGNHICIWGASICSE